jgi:type I restriction enzyme R subunit
LIRREETARAIEIGATGPRRRAKGRVDYLLRIKITRESEPVAVALIEEGKTPQPGRALRLPG